jgi:hypothetical protein
MARKTSILPVKMSFETTGLRVAIADINPLRPVTAAIKRTAKYTQIATSIQEIGIIEPPIVAHDRANPGKYLLLDGHLRIDALKELGVTEVVCIISTDDEAYTYNKRVSRLAIVQEHKMILKAIERGVSEERIAKTLNLDIKTLQQKKRMLTGICPEAIELLKDKHVASGTFWIFKKMVPFRQIEAAELMVAMNKYTISYGRSLLAATPQDQLVQTGKPKSIKGLTDEQISLMERESGNLEREFKMAEQSYGTDHLDLVLAKGYLSSLLGNPRVVRYLVQNHREILVEFQRIAELETAAA